MAASVLLVQADDAQRAAVHQALELRGGFVVVGEAADETRALAAAEAKQPDLVVVDLGIGDMAGHALIPRLRQAAPACRIVVCSSDLGAAREALSGSVDEYVDRRKGVPYLIELLTDMSRALYDSVTIRLGLDLDDVARARTFVTRQCEQWGCPAELVQDARLVASELVTNALVHAHSSCELQVRRANDVLRLEVQDHGTGVPDLQEPGTQRESGRGLLVVSLLTAAWGSERTEDGGKRVWAELLGSPGAPAGTTLATGPGEGEGAGDRRGGTTRPPAPLAGAPAPSSPPTATPGSSSSAASSEADAAIGLLREMSGLLSGAPNLEEMLASCATSLVRWLAASFAGIWLLERDGRTLSLAGSAGAAAPETRADEHIEIGDGVVGRIARTRRALFTNDPESGTSPSAPGTRGAGTPTVLGGGPIVSQGQLLGVVVVCRSQPFGARGEEMLGAVCDAMAVGVRRLRAERALREESAVLEALYRVGGLISHEHRVEAIVQAATDAATELTGAQFGAFFHNVEGDGAVGFELYALSGLALSDYEGMPPPQRSALFEPAFRGTGVVRCDDVTLEASFRGMPHGHTKVRSYLAVPVMSRVGEVLGAMFFGSERAGVFSDRSERIAVGIAAQAAAAIGSAMAYEREHRLALALQRSLLPHDVPVVSGLDIAVRYQAYGEGLEVGGDWYEVTTLRDGRVALSVGDAMGHDLRAAAAMTRVRHLLRAYAMDRYRPSEVLRKSNELLTDVGYVHMITALHAQFDPLTNIMVAASAGHPPPLVVDSRGRWFEPLALGPPLGVGLEGERPDHAVQLERGSIVVLYTDGLVERHDLPVAEGMARLKAAMADASGRSAEELCDLLLDDLAAGAEDDVALLVVARQ